jgi:hypothetical protein
MKTLPVSLIAASALLFALAPTAYAQPNNSMLYMPNVNLAAGTQNGFTGVVGGVFYTPYYFNVNVNYLGYADPTGAALTDSHTVTIWDGSGNTVASAVVPSGTPALLANGYDWVQLPSTITLSYQSYYEVGATVIGGVDSWGDLISNNSPDNGNNGQITWNVVNGTWGGDVNSPFVQAGSGWEFSRAGQYGNTALPGTQTSAPDSIYPAPNIGFNIAPAPEPATLSMMGMGMAVVLGIKRKQRR